MGQTLSTPETDAVIRVAALEKTYRRNRVRAARGVSFQVGKGQVFGLIGPDGAGKTSIIQILAGVLRASGGTAEVAGVDVLARPERIKGMIGYMPQGLGQNLYDTLTVQENIEFFRDLRQVPEGQFRENRDRLLAMTRLAPFLDRPAGKLSGGMRQKLALICTLIHLPDILLLDEPTTGVDPISRRDFWRIIQDLQATRAVTVLLTTSYMDEAERCHRVALMYDGEVIAEGSPEDLADSLPGKVLAIRAPDPRTALSSVRAWPEAEGAALYGAEVRVLLHEGAQAAAERLAAAGLPEASVRLTPPELEDVFVHHALERKALAPSQALRPLGVTKAAVPSGNGVVKTHRLTCRFGDFIAVNQVDLIVAPGEIFGLLGANGAGKTTLIKMLCGLLPPSEGSAQVAGLDVTKAREQLRNRIGYMSQRFSLYGDLAVRGNMELFAGLYGIARGERAGRIDAVLSWLDLGIYANRRTSSLPLGLRQRLALGCALLHQPPILFLDEPTSGVDPLARRQFWDIVHILARDNGVTILVSTHYMDEAEHCDRLGLMQQGRLIAVDTPAKLKRMAQERSGPILAVRTRDFVRALLLLQERFPGALLYGRRVQWQSVTPEEDKNLALEILSAAGVEAEISRQDLSMEDAFVHYIGTGG